MNAIGERITITAVARVKRLPKAGRTGCDIGKDPGSGRDVQTVDDIEIIRRNLPLDGGPVHRINTCQTRRFFSQSKEERIQFFGVPPGVDEHTFSVIQHLTGQPVLMGQSPDRGAKTNALHLSLYADRLPGDLRVGLVMNGGFFQGVVSRTIISIGS